MKTLLFILSVAFFTGCVSEHAPQAFKVTDIHNGKYVLQPIVATPQPLKIGDTVYSSKGKIKI